MIESKTILVTGGTGSFGKRFVREIVEKHRVQKLIIFSRDELKQQQMRSVYPETEDSPIRYFIGDVRDKERLYRALQGVDILVHAAALKQVPTAEYNPMEAIKTNVFGSANVIDAAIDSGVGRIILLSSDKAVNPINLYGATKLCAEKLFIAARSYVGSKDIRFSVVRYGNVVGSRGSVVPTFLSKSSSGVIPITDPRMTRFWITLDQGVSFVLKCINLMKGGETFIPKIPSMKVVDLAAALAPGCRHEVIGIRPGEKLHEVLISEEDAPRTAEYDEFFVIYPYPRENEANNATIYGERLVPESFRYSSDANSLWLSHQDLVQMVHSTLDSQEIGGNLSVNSQQTNAVKKN